MVSKRISELPAAGALDGSEQIPLTQDGETRRISGDTYQLALDHLSLMDGEFGAVGDGSADDTQAIKDWNAAVQSRNERGWAPEKTFRFTEKIELGGNFDASLATFVYDGPDITDGTPAITVREGTGSDTIRERRIGVPRLENNTKPSTDGVFNDDVGYRFVGIQHSHVFVPWIISFGTEAQITTDPNGGSSTLNSFTWGSIFDGEILIDIGPDPNSPSGTHCNENRHYGPNRTKISTSQATDTRRAGTRIIRLLGQSTALNGNVFFGPELDDPEEFYEYNVEFNTAAGNDIFGGRWEQNPRVLAIGTTDIRAVANHIWGGYNAHDIVVTQDTNAGKNYVWSARRSLEIGSVWNSNHLLMGTTHFWVNEATKRLRRKDGSAPTTDDDGVSVGAEKVTEVPLDLRSFEITRGDATEGTYTSPSVAANLDRVAIICPSTSSVNQIAREFVPSQDMAKVKIVWHWVNATSTTGDVVFRARKAGNMANSQGDDFNNETQDSTNDLISNGTRTVTDPGQHIRQVHETDSFAVTPGAPFYFWLRIDPTNLGADVYVLQMHIVAV